MPTFHWKDPNAGAAKRVAHYLATEVGEGNVFKKSVLREIIPNTEQVDRRMRDLRKVHWKIRTYRDRPGLRPEELLLEKIGHRVWEDGYKWPQDGLSTAVRRKVLERDGPRCMVCGIDFGAEYIDHPGITARPTIGHIVAKERGGTNELDNLRPECHLCNEQSRNLTASPIDIGLLQRRILQLGRAEKRKLLGWMRAERRSFTDTELLWAQVCRLPRPEREAIQRDLESAVEL
ncbi:MAG TPA: HNH endonuclease signature motif containing protein [Actinomycetota bacterium]|nr:HNH endonuclease signature motif containing protein [Actinomycetota bacterium]